MTNTTEHNDKYLALDPTRAVNMVTVDRDDILWLMSCYLDTTFESKRLTNISRESFDIIKFDLQARFDYLEPNIVLTDDDIKTVWKCWHDTFSASLLAPVINNQFVTDERHDISYELAGSLYNIVAAAIDDL